ncbi:phage tail terminator family protein [Paenibacillus ferrarius]|uniref:phage tail terminator family protein n=1 Tax=Paenibacillus ferrarius TaxID=1469647 RepID=UPI003D2D3A08
MVKLIEQSILNGITVKLDNLFPDHPIYSEQVKQGFSQPAFFVMQLNSGETPGLNRRSLRSLLYDIHYFPDEESLTVKSDCRIVAEKLYDQLQYIDTAGGKVRAFSRRYEVVNDVLHFYLSFNVPLVTQKPEVDKMATIRQKEGIKIGE